MVSRRRTEQDLFVLLVFRRGVRLARTADKRYHLGVKASTVTFAWQASGFGCFVDGQAQRLRSASAIRGSFGPFHGVLKSPELANLNPSVQEADDPWEASPRCRTCRSRSRSSDSATSQKP